MEALTITGAAFAGIGLLLVVVGIVIARSQRAFHRRARRAPGYVTDVKWSAVGPQADTTMAAYPVVRFTLPDGREVETTARTGTTVDAMKQGKRVTVLNDPDDPAQAQVASSGGAIASGVFIGVGVILMLLGAGLIAAGIALDDALPAAVIHS
jgi:hypothetical protein